MHTSWCCHFCDICENVVHFYWPNCILSRHSWRKSIKQRSVRKKFIIIIIITYGQLYGQHVVKYSSIGILLTPSNKRAWTNAMIYMMFTKYVSPSYMFHVKSCSWWSLSLTAVSMVISRASLRHSTIAITEIAHHRRFIVFREGAQNIKYRVSSLKSRVSDIKIYIYIL